MEKKSVRLGQRYISRNQVWFKKCIQSANLELISSICSAMYKGDSWIKCKKNLWFISSVQLDRYILTKSVGKCHEWPYRNYLRKEYWDKHLTIWQFFFKVIKSYHYLCRDRLVETWLCGNKKLHAVTIGIISIKIQGSILTTEGQENLTKIPFLMRMMAC